MRALVNTQVCPSSVLEGPGKGKPQEQRAGLAPGSQRPNTTVHCEAPGPFEDTARGWAEKAQEEPRTPCATGKEGLTE